MKSLLWIAPLTFALLAVHAAAPIQDGASVLDSGSTNRPGALVRVRADGSAFVERALRGVQHPPTTNAHVNPALAARLLADAKIARTAGLTRRLGVPCMKSVSFGSSLFVTWHGWRSPDLFCPVNGPAVALKADAQAILAAAAPPIRSIQPLPNEVRRPLPSPSASLPPAGNRGR